MRTIDNTPNAIVVNNLSKCFKIYKTPTDLFKEHISGKKRHQEFWALSDVSFELKKGRNNRNNR